MHPSWFDIYLIINLYEHRPALAERCYLGPLPKELYITTTVAYSWKTKNENII